MSRILICIIFIASIFATQLAQAAKLPEKLAFSNNAATHFLPDFDTEESCRKIGNVETDTCLHSNKHANSKPRCHIDLALAYHRDLAFNEFPKHDLTKLKNLFSDSWKTVPALGPPRSSYF